MADGDPDGLKVVTKSGWSGVGLVVPRALLGEAKRRNEFARSGVYLLVGPPDSGTLPKVYIGEGDPVRNRIEQHSRKYDFWTRAVVFTDTGSLNKAHVQYLEAELVRRATEAKRCKLENLNTPTLPSISDATTAEARGYLDALLLCLPILGYQFFDSAPAPRNKTLEYELRGRGIRARGFETPGGFVVKAGSTAATTETDSCHGFLKSMRAELLANKVLSERDGHLELIQDYVFTSPSMASGVMLGASSNGRIAWKTRDRKTLKLVQESRD
jgi:hypothetical protein